MTMVVTKEAYEDLLAALKENRDAYEKSMAKGNTAQADRLDDIDQAMELFAQWDEDGLREKADLLIRAKLLQYKIIDQTVSIQATIDKLKQTATDLNTAGQVLDAILQVAKAVLAL